jgi:hypothetical protein
MWAYAKSGCFDLVRQNLGIHRMINEFHIQRFRIKCRMDTPACGHEYPQVAFEERVRSHDVWASGPKGAAWPRW